MNPTNIATIARWANGQIASGDLAVTVTSLCTDSRALQPGDLFLALRGDNFDGHTFAAEAISRGATGIVVQDVPSGLPPEANVIQVGDTLAALQAISAQYRRSLDLRVVAITGSNGKTSTKDLTASVLSKRFQVTKTKGNFNNHIGLPLTMLRANATDQIGVFEIGMNHPGEIAPLAALAAPDVAIITNIGVAHIEFLGSREAIAQEKGMLAEALPASGHLILGAEDDFSRAIAERTLAHTILCGIGTGEVQATDVTQSFSGMRFRLHADGRAVDAELPVPGLHMVRNALLAVAAGRVLGLSLDECAEGLRSLQLTKGRLEQKEVRGIQIIDDTYNANPDSMSAALRTISEMPGIGRRIAVLGRMGELGAEAERGHRQVGEVAAALKFDYLITVGEEAGWIAEAAATGGVETHRYGTTEEAAAALREFAKEGDLVLVKGSRSARMERIVEALQSA
ncbi:MAG TPA: UDP-N-acetylmuramoyl-tripeptide--D-alanyl-D-alanine ligase [Chthoniobacteraceae bacterium]|jgi:UDP-N-acetylmuramoyl-tripeptide--D-alanyl-D-alanine ligase